MLFRSLDVLRLDARPALKDYEKTICVMERQTKRMTALVLSLIHISKRIKADLL